MVNGRYKRALELIAEHEGEAGGARALDALIAHLKRTGRLKLLPEFRRELVRIRARAARLAPVVEVAHQHDATEALARAAHSGIPVAHARVNHELLSGWRARAHGKLADHSGKGALVAIYQKVTS